MSKLNGFLPLRLPAAQAQEVKRLAAASDTTASAIVRQAIAVFVAAQLSPPTRRPPSPAKDSEP